MKIKFIVIVFIFATLMWSFNEPITKHINVQQYSVPSVEMILVEGGTFKLGCDDDGGDNDCFSWEQPSHQVVLSSFYISKYEVTQGFYKQIMNDKNPSFFKGDSLPVESLSYEEARDFIVALNNLTGKSYRFPTEAEWEFAAEGGKKTKGYIYSGSNVLKEVAWYHENSDHQTHPVGLLKPNELGIYDMTGNVEEFCYDWYSSYKNRKETNPRGPFVGTDKVIRGGSWDIDNDFGWNINYRNYISLRDKTNDTGIRLVIGTND